MAFAISFVVLFSLVLSASLSIQQELTTTFKTKHGVYDCVDFYQQPAFDNPLLKNLTHQAIPKDKLAKIQAQNTDEIGLEDVGCPIGTVPILQATANSTHFPQTSSSNGGGLWPWISWAKVAVFETRARTMQHPTEDIYGIKGSISLYKPYVRKTQWSAARLRLKTGSEFMEAGWMVNPDLYKDNEAHLYVKHESKKPECSSPSCFVQVARGVPLGLTPKHYSKINGAQWSWNLTIIKHVDDGNWWLTITAKMYTIGYWPKGAFESLSYIADQAEWGGEISRGSLDISQQPEMGAGQIPTLDPKSSANIWDIGQIIHPEGSYEILDPQDTTKVSNCKSYTIEDGGSQDAFYHHIILFGGPLA